MLSLVIASKNMRPEKKLDARDTSIRTRWCPTCIELASFSPDVRDVSPCSNHVQVSEDDPHRESPWRSHVKRSAA